MEQIESDKENQYFTTSYLFIAHPVGVWDRGNLFDRHIQSCSERIDSVCWRGSPSSASVSSVGLFLIWLAGNGCFCWICGFMHMQICDNQESEEIRIKMWETLSDLHWYRESHTRKEGRSTDDCVLSFLWSCCCWSHFASLYQTESRVPIFCTMLLMPFTAN